MKILIATGIYPPDIGGPATYSKIIAEELTKRGHSIMVITYGTIKNSKYVRTVSHRLPKGVRHFIYFWNVLRYGARADIIFAQDPVSVGVPSALAAKLLRKKFVAKIVGDYAWEQGVQRFGVKELLDDFSQRRYGFQVEFLRRIECWVAKYALCVVVPSEYLKRVIISWGVHQDRIAVIPNGVEITSPPSREQARRDLCLDGIVLLSVGRLVPWKGFDMIIEMMSDLQPLPAKLIIVGDGPGFGALKALRDRLKLAGSVDIVSSVSKERLAGYMAAADIFLLNTAYEGFSHQIIEAMAAGLPIVTTLSGGNAEIVEDSKNALVARYNKKEEWNRAVMRLMKDERLRRELVEEAKKTAANFTTGRMIHSLLTLLEKIWK